MLCHDSPHWTPWPWTMSTKVIHLAHIFDFSIHLVLVFGISLFPALRPCPFLMLCHWFILERSSSLENCLHFKGNPYFPWMFFFVPLTNLKTCKDKDQNSVIFKYQFVSPHAILCSLHFKMKHSLRLTLWIFKNYGSWFALCFFDKHQDQNQLWVRKGLFQFTFPRLKSNTEGS